MTSSSPRRPAHIAVPMAGPDSSALEPEVHLSDRARPPSDEELEVLAVALADAFTASRQAAVPPEGVAWRLSGRWWHPGVVR